jgi:putative mycofactocin binding protein MftB
VVGSEAAATGLRRDSDGAPTGSVRSRSIDAVVFDPNRSYALHPSVALRPEPFGALAYHYGNRKLVFLRSPRLLALVPTLGQHASVSAALDTLGLGDRARDKYLAALASLAASDMLAPTATDATDTDSTDTDSTAAGPTNAKEASCH